MHPRTADNPVAAHKRSVPAWHRDGPELSGPDSEHCRGERFPRTDHSLSLLGLLSVVVVLILCGCGSSAVVQKGPAGDRDLERYNQAAQRAYELGRLQQAAESYRKALARAYLADDSEAILDAQYNLAVCLTKLQSYEAALGTIRQAESEAARSGQGSSADYLLLEATVYQRTGNLEQAWKISEQILAATPPASAIIQNKTHFLRGLIAQARGDTNVLRAEISSLGEPTEFQLRADRRELLGYLALAEQNWVEAVEDFDRAADLRRAVGDYRPMVKVLALAADASERAGRAEAAAARYLRAGRSAALQGADDQARSWLIRAERLANEAGDADTAEESRAYLKQIQDTQ